MCVLNIMACAENVLNSPASKRIPGQETISLTIFFALQTGMIID